MEFLRHRIEKSPDSAARGARRVFARGTVVYRIVI